MYLVHMKCAHVSKYFFKYFVRFMVEVFYFICVVGSQAAWFWSRLSQKNNTETYRHVILFNEQTFIEGILCRQ